MRSGYHRCKKNANKYNRIDKDVLKNLWDLAGTDIKVMKLKNAIVEGIFGKFDTGAVFKGNGMTMI